MKHGIAFLFALSLGALSLGATGCGGEQHPAGGPGGGPCQCDHKDGHCEHCKNKEAGHECKCEHKPGEHCEHCDGKHAHGPGGPGGDHHGDHAHGPGGEHPHGEGDGHHADENKGPLGDVHAVLAPIWHSPAGPDRLAKACDQAKVMRDKSAAVEAAPAPAGADAAAYTAAAKEMTAAGDTLVTACAAAGRPDAEAKFAAFHTAFHKTVEKGSGKPHKD